MDKEEAKSKFEKMPLEEKLKLLTEKDKAYIKEYIEKAFSEQQQAQSKQGSRG